jgi:membrane-associated protease RseP (regulator of RpoE activity)
MVADQSTAEVPSQLRMAVADVFDVHEITAGHGARRAIQCRGRLLVEPVQAYDRVAGRLSQMGYTALFRQDGESDLIIALPATMSKKTGQSAWLAIAMFVATLTSVLSVGAGMEQVRETDLYTLQGLLRGWPFALSLLSILAAHEFGHYIVARYLGTPVSLPHFIPMPFGPLGTMGAVINMKGPPRNRRHLLAIAAAGPMAGLLLAIPILILGLSISEIGRIPTGPVLIEGNSLLYLLLKFLLFGQYLPSGGIDVFLHPVAFAGWAGLMITGVNLIPVGQLDGGHITYALLGRRTRWLNWCVIASLALLALVLRHRGQPWDGWFLWAALLLVFGRRSTVLLDDITRLDIPRKMLVMLALVLFVLTFVPNPMRIG